MYRSSWCDIDLVQFRANISKLREVAAPAKALLVVKANAYGHGLVPISIEALKAGIDTLGVATIGEAEALRNQSIEAPILIMCAIDDQELQYCVANRVSFMASRVEQILLAHRFAEEHGIGPRIHV